MKKEIKPSPQNQDVSARFTDQLYQAEVNFVDEQGNPVDIPESGFLGLLAAGYKGLAMMRKRRGQTHLYRKFTKGKKMIRRNQAGRKKTVPKG